MDGLARLGWMGIVGGVVLGCTPPTEDVGQLDGQNDDGPTGTAALDSSGDVGSTSASSSAGDAGLVSNCPADAVEERGPCNVGNSCDHGDFVCECECLCDRGPDGNGVWECRLARQDILTLEDASLAIDCASGSIVPSGTFVVDHAGGSRPLEFTVNGFYSISGTDLDCGPYCFDCDPVATVVVAPGTSETFAAAYVPGTCDDDAVAAVCDACEGARVQLGISWVAAADGASQGDGQIYEDVPVVCG
jgi:hypothetical protein